MRAGAEGVTGREAPAADVGEGAGWLALASGSPVKVIAVGLNAAATRRISNWAIALKVVWTGTVGAVGLG